MTRRADDTEPFALGRGWVDRSSEKALRVALGADSLLGAKSIWVPRSVIHDDLWSALDETDRRGDVLAAVRGLVCECDAYKGMADEYRRAYNGLLEIREEQRRERDSKPHDALVPDDEEALRAKLAEAEEEIARLRSENASLRTVPVPGQALAALVKHGGALVSSNDCSYTEIAYARSCPDTFFVTSDGFGFVRRSKGWLEHVAAMLAKDATEDPDALTRETTDSSCDRSGGGESP